MIFGVPTVGLIGPDTALWEGSQEVGEAGKGGQQMGIQEVLRKPRGDQNRPGGLRAGTVQDLTLWNC